VPHVSVYNCTMFHIQLKIQKHHCVQEADKWIMLCIAEARRLQAWNLTLLRLYHICSLSLMVSIQSLFLYTLRNQQQQLLTDIMKIPFHKSELVPVSCLYDTLGTLINILLLLYVTSTLWISRRSFQLSLSVHSCIDLPLSNLFLSSLHLT
jgi:hypothetical protein